MVAAEGTSKDTMPWGRFALPEDAPLRFQLGPLTILVLKAGDEIRTRTIQEGTHEPSSGTVSGSSAWSRWAAPEDPGEIEFLPAFPDRPLVLRPEDPFYLLPGAHARVYVRVPVSIQVRIPVGTGATIMEIPTFSLSETWWGDAEAGELCYWLHIVARRDAPPEIFRPDRIICPVDLVNEAREELPVEKILLRCEHLSVFRGASSLWSDEIRVRHRGEEIGSDLEMTGRNPPEAPRATRVNPPRVPVAKGFRARTFARLRGLSGLGGTF